MADPQRSGVFCAPAEPAFDEKAADELANATQTDASDWAFPIRDGIEVRSAAKQDAPVIDKLGLYLVRVLPDDSPANAVLAAFVKVMTPGGKVGFVPIEAVLPIGGEQLCYVRRRPAGRSPAFLAANRTVAITRRRGRHRHDGSMEPANPSPTVPGLRPLRRGLRLQARRRLLVSRRNVSPPHASGRIGTGLSLSHLPAGRPPAIAFAVCLNSCPAELVMPATTKPRPGIELK